MPYVKADRSIADKGKGIYSSEDKKDTPGSFSGKTRQIKCFKYLGFGHIAAQCPNQRMMTTIEMESKGDEEEVTELADLSAVLDECYGYKELEEHGDQGDDPYLTINVLRRVMSTFPTNEEDRGRIYSIFHVGF